jgi:hypothetical protein
MAEPDNKYTIQKIGIIGVIALLFAIIIFVAFGMGSNEHFTSIAKVVAGIAVQIFNVSGGGVIDE